jgi:hypothetical protein
VQSPTATGGPGAVSTAETINMQLLTKEVHNALTSSAELSCQKSAMSSLKERRREEYLPQPL